MKNKNCRQNKNLCSLWWIYDLLSLFLFNNYSTILKFIKINYYSLYEMTNTSKEKFKWVSGPKVKSKIIDLFIFLQVA